ncbi:MAG: hypothetical protein AB8D52_06695 [Gammaproteobacteria bacterium]
MTDSVDISDLTLKQLLHFYKEKSSTGSTENSLQQSRSATSTNDPQVVQKFSEIMDGSFSTEPEVEQNLANIVDDLIKMIGDQT